MGGWETAGGGGFGVVQMVRKVLGEVVEGVVEECVKELVEEVAEALRRWGRWYRLVLEEVDYGRL